MAFTWLAIVLAVGTLVVFFTPGIRIAALAPQTDLVINTAATIAAGCVAAFAWIRYRDSSRPDALLQSLAFLTLCLAGAIRTGLQMTGHDIYAGFTSDNPGQAPVYSWTVARLLSGILLLAGAVANINGWGPPRRRIRLLLALVPVLTIVYTVSVYARDTTLPVILPPQTVQDVLARGSVLGLGRGTAPPLPPPAADGPGRTGTRLGPRRQSRQSPTRRDRALHCLHLRCRRARVRAGAATSRTRRLHGAVVYFVIGRGRNPGPLRVRSGRIRRRRHKRRHSSPRLLPAGADRGRHGDS